MKLAKILAEKKSVQKLYTVDSTATIREAARKMVSLRPGCLMVVQHESDPMKFVGLITKIDLLRALCFENSNLDSDTVDKVMTRNMIVASVEDDVDYVMNVMVRHEISYLPLIDGKEIAGVISMGDLMSGLNTEKDIQLRWANDFLGAPSPRCEVY